MTIYEKFSSGHLAGFRIMTQHFHLYERADVVSIFRKSALNPRCIALLLEVDNVQKLRYGYILIHVHYWLHQLESNAGEVVGLQKRRNSQRVARILLKLSTFSDT